MADLTPAETLRAAAQALSDATDDVHTSAEYWHEQFADGNRCELPAVNRFIRAMNPAVGRALADWLRTWEGFEFREDGPMPDDLAAALRIARAVNGGTR